MAKSSSYPLCKFFDHHPKDFNYGLCPCGDSFKKDGVLYCSRTKELISKRRKEGYYFKCEYISYESENLANETEIDCRLA